MKRSRFAKRGSFLIAMALLLVVSYRGVPAEPTTSRVAPVDLSQLRDITGIERHGAAEPEESAPGGPWAFVSAILVVGVILWLWRRRKLNPAPTAEEWALAEIARVEALRLPEAGALERFYIMLSDVLRRYLELRFDLPASRLTTEEFLQAAATSAHLPPARRDLAASFLDQCDLVKFARADFSPEKCQKALALARALVRHNETGIGHDGRGLACDDLNLANRKARGPDGESQTSQDG